MSDPLAMPISRICANASYHCIRGYERATFPQKGGSALHTRSPSAGSATIWLRSARLENDGVRVVELTVLNLAPAECRQRRIAVLIEAPLTEGAIEVFR